MCDISEISHFFAPYIILNTSSTCALGVTVIDVEIELVTRVQIRDGVLAFHSTIMPFPKKKKKKKKKKKRKTGRVILRNVTSLRTG